MKKSILPFLFFFFISISLKAQQHDLIITEIMFDVPADTLGDANGDGHRGSHSDEFVELYNKGTSPIDLTAYQIIEREGIPVFTFPVGATLNPGQFAVVFGAIGTNGVGSNIPKDALVFAVHPNDDNNDGFDNGAGKSNFSNSSDRVMIVNSLLADTVAEVYWGGTTAHPIAPFTKNAIYLGPPNTLSGDSLSGSIRQSVTHDINSSKWDLHTYVTGDPNYLFSPGKNAEQSTTPPPATIKITEIMFDVPSDSLGDANGDGVRGSHSDEFVEIYNYGIKEIDLSGFKILDRKGLPVFSFPTGATLKPNQFGVVFGSVGPNGFGKNIPQGTALFAVDTTTDNANVGFDNGAGKSNFSNKGDAVILVNTTVPDTVQEIYWGTATPHTKNAIYLGPPNTLTGDTISGSIKQSVTCKIDNDKWDLHTIVSGDPQSYFSPGANAPKAHVNITSDVIITEVMFDVPPDTLGDANGDGVRGSHSDEFIEIYNKGSKAVDISGYQFLESHKATIFTFPKSTIIQPKQFAVVFGAVGPKGFGNPNIPSETLLFAVDTTNDDSNIGFDNGQGKSNLSQSGDCVALVNPAANDTLMEVFWGTANPISSNAVYLGYPNTITGNNISGNIDQSVTRKVDNNKWDLHTVVSGSPTTLYSPGWDASPLTEVRDEHGKIPSKFTLWQNYPNPFNPSTVIRFDLPKAGNVVLNIYDILGRRVAQLINKKLRAGNYKFTWNASNLSTGVYLYQLKVNNRIITKKMLLLK